MAYSREGVMAQIAIAFGQGAGAIRVSQEAAMELRRWYLDAITDKILNDDWEAQAVEILERIRAIGALAERKARDRGDTKITATDVYSSAKTVQETSNTDYCPPPPPAG